MLRCSGIAAADRADKPLLGLSGRTEQRAAIRAHPDEMLITAFVPVAHDFANLIHGEIAQRRRARRRRDRCMHHRSSLCIPGSLFHFPARCRPAIPDQVRMRACPLAAAISGARASAFAGSAAHSRSALGVHRALGRAVPRRSAAPLGAGARLPPECCVRRRGMPFALERAEHRTRTRPRHFATARLALLQILLGFPANPRRALRRRGASPRARRALERPMAM